MTGFWMFAASELTLLSCHMEIKQRQGLSFILVFLTGVLYPSYLSASCSQLLSLVSIWSCWCLCSFQTFTIKQTNLVQEVDRKSQILQSETCSKCRLIAQCLWLNRNKKPNSSFSEMLILQYIWWIQQAYFKLKYQAYQQRCFAWCNHTFFFYLTFYEHRV